MNNVEILEKNEKERQARLKGLGLTEEQINENKKLIKEVDQNTSDELGKKLVSKIGSKTYDETGELDDVLKLIKDGANLQYVSQNNNFPLLLCAKKGYVTTFLTLLKFGADINHHNGNLTTPVMSAARHGEMDILSIAILVGADINARCFDGDTALMMAKRHGKTWCYKALIQANANIANKNCLNLSSRVIQNVEGENVNDDIYYAEKEYIPYKAIVSETLSDAISDARNNLHELALNYQIRK